MKRNKGAKMSSLFPDDGDSGDEESSSTTFGISNKKHVQENGKPGGFSINKGYAERYDSWRGKEEMMKMKARYGTDNLDEIEQLDSDDESSSSEEDEWTPEQEKEFFKTLANLKKKDPKIYDAQVSFFSKGEGAAAGPSGASTSTTVNGNVNRDEKKSKKKEKPFLLKDHERTMILEKGGLMSDDEDEDIKKEPEHVPISYYEELDSIKKGFTSALKEIDSDDEDGLASSSNNKLLMKKKVKTEAETAKEDEEYRMWLKGELGRLEKGKLSKDEEKELGFLRSYWTDEKLDDGEKFLRDYVLNRKYIEPEDETYTPKYNEIAHDSDEGGLSNDEQFESQREEFEHKYNFRFEEPDPEFIKRFPRTIQDSLRRENEKRKKARESAKERRNEAKERKKDEVQRLKAAKRKEIIDKMRQLQEISGNPDLPVDDLDIEGDFDPEEYDRKMKKLFDEQYYNEEATDEVKPEFPFDPEIDDEVNWEEWVPTEDENTEESNNDDEDAQEEDVNKKRRKVKSGRYAAEERAKQKKKESAIEELIEASKGKRAAGGKKKSVFLEVLEKKKPKFDPKLHKSFGKYFEEYYALDFEDLVGDLPCRFKYRKVTPNDFGLSMNEILKAPDKELNKWASLKKTYQYRPEDEEKYEAQAYQKKAENENLKKKVLLSLYLPTGANQNDSDQNDETAEAEQSNVEASEKSKKRKKKKKKKSKSVDESTTEIVQSEEEHSNNLADHDQPSHEISSKKAKKRKLSLNESNSEAVQCNTEPEPTASSDQQMSVEPKKSKKKKQTISLDEQTVELRDQKHENSSNKSKKKRKESFEKRHHKGGGVKRKADVDIGIEDDRLKAYGLNPTKYKKWVKYGGSSKNK